MEQDPILPILALIAAKRARLGNRLLVLGLCGAQGSGKSTLAGRLDQHLADRGVSSCVLSLDDLYLTRSDRDDLASKIHPLLRTRGVPGTHDVGLGIALIEELDAARAVRLPRFDKGYDDRAPVADWKQTPDNLQILILEGWCVGARPESEATLFAPVNALERKEDGDGLWRRFVNASLAMDYQRLFMRLDLLVFLAAPGFAVVRTWRIEQERNLRACKGRGKSDEYIARFVLHYERLTRHMLEDMPRRADLTISLRLDRSVRALTYPERTGSDQ